MGHALHATSGLQDEDQASAKARKILAQKQGQHQPQQASAQASSLQPHQQSAQRQALPARPNDATVTSPLPLLERALFASPLRPVQTAIEPSLATPSTHHLIFAPSPHDQSQSVALPGEQRMLSASELLPLPTTTTNVSCIARATGAQVHVGRSRHCTSWSCVEVLCLDKICMTLKAAYLPVPSPVDVHLYET